MRRIFVVLLVTVFALSVSARAQDRQSQPPEPAAPVPATETVDATKLGVSLDRIKRELAQGADESQRDGALKLSFTVQVIGQAPKINLLEGFAVSGPLPYGGPTHREMLDVVTPQLFRQPVMPFSAMAVWAAQKLSEKSKKDRCEEEIEQYRRQVMAGIAVTAPRCSQ
jgi:hypothetical protein